MKTSKFSEAQIAFVLKQAKDGTPGAEVCRKAGMGRGHVLMSASGGSIVDEATLRNGF